MQFPSSSANTAPRFSWQILPACEISPEAWLRTMWKEDFEEGLPGHLDVINHDVAQELFAAQNSPIVHNGEKPTWWPGEQEGYWHEAYIHAAFQLGDEAAIQRATNYVEAVLRSQGPSGYMGIYNPASRLLRPDDVQYGEFGGELHAQVHLFLALIAFYEYTGRAEVLEAVEKAAQLTIASYPDGPFGTAGEQTPLVGGNSHSGSFIDGMMQLYRHTGDERYLTFVALMYSSYTKHPPRDHDLIPKVLDDHEACFHCHGAHTAESFHWASALVVAGLPGAEARAEAAMEKLGRHLTPGGAMVSNEFVEGLYGNGYELYEYCTQAELIKSLTWIAQYQSDTVAAGRAERMFLNASMGARIHPLGGLQYMSRDDRIEIPDAKEREGVKNLGKTKHFQISSIIRPTCCPASAGRPVHYYLSSAWMKRPAGDALALMNFMPCTLRTEIAGVELVIEEQTQYPFSDSVKLAFTVSSPARFPIAIRLPEEGSLKVVPVDGMEQSEKDGFLWLTKEWKTGDVVDLELDLPVVLEKTKDGKASYYRRGPITYALRFAADLTKVEENPNWRTGEPGGLFEYAVAVEDQSTWGSRIDPAEKFVPVSLPGDFDHPWNEPVIGLKGKLIDAEGKPFPVTLVPEGAAISRRVTFLDTSHSPEEAAQQKDGREASIGH
ncbi:beta-L-arabinofuranosidase domain-containing protein [Coraliomargarita parva]|uniref:beta-L-arabinofuranosidase domain-containing protein n=1 Tax=Coraliomargarita parva TaxID=3014050 RepID=UPI0022B5D42C|nr:beta-L-arabinofuranosidase domain-containing protein [Coraliomargarita parva]